MIKFNEKWTLFLIATFVTFFGITDNLLKGTESTDEVAVNTVLNDTKNQFDVLFNESITVDEENKHIKYLVGGTTVKELFNNVTIVGGSAKLYDINSSEKNDDDILATGDILTMYLNEEEKVKYTISVVGDATGDGIVDLRDLGFMRKHIVGWLNSDINVIESQIRTSYYALDINQDGIVDLVDLRKMRRMIVGLE